MTYLLVLAVGAGAVLFGLGAFRIGQRLRRGYRREEEAAEEQAEQSARLEALSDSMPGVPYEFRVGPDGEQSLAFIGEGAGELLGLPTEAGGFYERFVEHIPDSHREKFLRSVEKAVASQSHWQLEVPFDRPSGDRMWLLGSAEPEPNGKGILFRGLLLDITERIEEERRREQVIQRVTDTIMEVDAEWRLTLVNDQAESLFDVPEEELLGRKFWNVFAQAQGTRIEKESRRAMQTRKPVRFEEHFEGLDAWFNIQAYPNPDGGLAFYFDDVTERRERDAQLREREEMLRSITENVSEGIYRSTSEEGIAYANSAFVEMFGYESLEALRSADPSEFYADPAEREALYREEDEQGGLDKVEVQFQRTDGSVFTGLLSTKTVQSPGGERTYNDGAVTDITERKARERRFEQAETLFQNAQDALFLIDVEREGAERAFTYRRANPIYEKTFGHAEDDICGRSPSEVFGKEPGAFLEAKCRKCKRRKASLDYEEKLYAKGEAAYFRARLAPVVVDGQVQQIVGTLRDITERKRREETIETRRRKIEALYKATSGLFSIDRRDAVPDRILVVLEEVFDFPLVHIGLVEDGAFTPKKTVAEDLARMPEPRPRPMDADLAATRAIRAGEAVVIDSSDDLESELDYGALTTLAGIPIAGHGAVVLGREQGRFSSFNLHLLEVLASYAALALERLEREETLVEAREEAEEAAQLKSAMLANMSHEVRTPLMSMIGSADLLREDVEGEDAEMAEQIFRSGQRLQETLTSVLELSRLEGDAYTLDDDPVQLDVIVREVAQDLNLRAYEKDVQLEVDSPGASVEARLDETATRRIVTNLVENAIKFTPEGGRVQVRTRSEGDETVLLEVEDTGVGIAEDAKPKIFDAFKQESEGLDREYEGSGLGLSIVDRLTTYMDGSIEVESEKGVGTQFAVRFPR
ncbi:PAS domain-containing sensor histidine kinase [Salinibacter altiplanensis]|uniref:PAS domain-containing sensor histidine kinase n=1 Tax=Salinibacter altiplanensis TaxID=1803181 RepID=UPI000C9F5036|nr:PAS domain-containing sensor histidine kinase [Salinibacter altiplanensis]